MPPLPSVAGVVKVAVIHSYGTDTDVVSRFFIKYTGVAPTAGQLDTFCTAVNGAWADQLAELAYVGVAVTEVNAVDLTSDTSASGLDTTGATGSRTGTLVSADTCLLAAYEVNRRYRGGHPRGYWPLGVEEDFDTPQTWTTDFVGDCNTALPGFLTEVIAAGWAGAGTLSHVNVSFYDGFTVVISPTTGRARNIPTPRGAPIVDPVVSVATRSRVASQRRRLGR